jgi:hypothetical protein
VPCLIGCIALAFPRVALFLVWFFGGSYLMRPFEHWIWPLLGFVFLPLTTLAFVYAMNSMGPPGAVPPLGWILIALAALADLGLIGGGSRQAQQYRQEHYD